MRLRTTLAFAVAAAALVQALVVLPLAGAALKERLDTSEEARVDRLMVGAEAALARQANAVSQSVAQVAAHAELQDALREGALAPTELADLLPRLAAQTHLDVLTAFDAEGTVLGSAHFPARALDRDETLWKVATTDAGIAQVEFSSAEGLTRVPCRLAGTSSGETKGKLVGGVRLGSALTAELERLTGAAVTLNFDGATLATAGNAAAPGALNRQLNLGAGLGAQFSFSSDVVRGVRQELERSVATALALGVLGAVLVGLLAAQRLARPVEALTRGAQAVARGEWSTRVEVAGAPQELRGFVDTFNHMTESLRQTRERLVATERIAAWQEAAKRIAHEIKNPLTPIRMSLETLLAASEKHPEAVAPLLAQSGRAVLDEVARLTRIVDEFSTFARLPKPSLAPVDVSLVGPKVASLVAQAWEGSGVQLLVDVEPGVVALADEDQLNQVLQNLLKNAREAMDGRTGTITLRVKQVENACEVSVLDEGPGLPDEVKKNLFTPYFSTKATGTGLGLSIAARIAHEHGGSLRAHSGDRGASFILTLPGA